MKKNVPAGLMSMAEYARHRGCNPSHISRLAAAGVLILRSTPGGRQLVEFARSDRILDDVPDVSEEPPRPEVAGQHPRTGYAEAKLILMIYTAKLARLDFESKEGRLIDADAVKRRIAGHVDLIRDGLAALADRLSGPIALETDSKRVHALMTSELRRELVRLATVVGGGSSTGSPPQA
jgi:hypothetical protein